MGIPRESSGVGCPEQRTFRPSAKLSRERHIHISLGRESVLVSSAEVRLSVAALQMSRRQHSQRFSQVMCGVSTWLLRDCGSLNRRMHSMCQRILSAGLWPGTLSGMQFRDICERERQRSMHSVSIWDDGKWNSPGWMSRMFIRNILS